MQLESPLGHVITVSHSRLPHNRSYLSLLVWNLFAFHSELGSGFHLSHVPHDSAGMGCG